MIPPKQPLNERLRGLLTAQRPLAPQDVTAGPSGPGTAAGVFPGLLRAAGEVALGAVPGVGQAMDVRDFEQARREGSPVGMALAAAGGVPVAGDVVKQLGKAGRKIADWRWRPFRQVAEEVNLSALPAHVEDFGAFMQEQASRASRGQMGPRDMLKANAITQASIQRTARDADALRSAGMTLPSNVSGAVRPEGAMAEWLLTPSGQRYLNQAERGVVDRDVIEEIVSQFKPFGKDNTLRNSLIENVEIGKMGPQMNQVVASAAKGDRAGARRQMAGVVQNVRGVADAKQGFLGSLLGYGIDPTFDARQIRLHTGAGGDEAKKFISRKGGGAAAVARLADRQRRMDISLPSEMKPFDQHLWHHAVWDKVGNQVTTHSDLMKAMRLAGLAAMFTGGAAMNRRDEDQR
jgi:hypothetical protein